MTPHSSVFRLSVVQVDQTCLFELAWGHEQKLKTQLPYPNSLLSTYQKWQRIYLQFYQNNLLGRVESSGTLELPNIDWHGLLVKAEAALLSELNQWLRQSELYEIRSTIIHAARPLDVFLACTPLELERLPWEAWELWATAGSMIRVARTPANIRHESIQGQHRRPRILVIIGADDQNKFSHDLQVVKKQFKQIAQVEAIGWRLTANDIPELKQQIWDAIAAPPGWDALLFFGHSNESALTGGELAIAPNTWISIQELTPPLLKAKEHGLQFALFNSCSGLNIAESLISLGLGQVAIMREPIHNAVAQHFLIHFLQKLASQENVHQSLFSACQNLLDQKLVYPSAYLIPSLFRYPNAPLFQIEPIGWKPLLKSWKPTLQETLFTGALAMLSLLWPVQDSLLDLRMLVQGVYRDVTAMVNEPSSLPTPPILLVQIDDKSLLYDKVTQRRPMDRAYLARLIHQLATLKPRVIGIDYVLDAPQPNTDPVLAQSVKHATQQGIRFVFAAVPPEFNSAQTDSPNHFLDPKWSFAGSIEGSHRFIPLISSQVNCGLGCESTRNTLRPSPPAPPPERERGARTQPTLVPLLSLWEKGLGDEGDLFCRSTQSVCPFAQMLVFASRQLSQSAIAPLDQPQRQPWLTPINDFSISPDHVFQNISAFQVFSEQSKHWNQFKLNQPPIIIIAPGGYAEAGVREAGEDNLAMPWVISYWRSRLGQIPASVFTGGEAHAYRVYQLLHQKWVIPLPDLLLIGCAALLGKQIQLHLKKRSFKEGRWKGYLALMTGSYGFLGLQLYISAGILCPWLFPSVTFWYYVFPTLKKKSDA